MRGIAKRFWIFPFVFIQCLFFWAQGCVVCAQSGPDDRKSDKNLIPESLIYLGCDDGARYALVVDKESQVIRLYEYKNGYALRHRFPCSTGEKPGEKKRAGDRKTPEGVYFFTKSFKKRYLSPTYGNRAFVMDYPNLLDSRNGLNGDNIWLHGTDKTLKPRDTNGCIAVENGNIDILARYVRLNHTPIIIKKKLNMVSPESTAPELEGLLAFLERWKRAFLAGDRDTYSSCYESPSEEDEKLWQTWGPLRASWQKAGVTFRMSLKGMTIARANPCIVALFDQVFHLDPHITTVGTKKLFLEQGKRGWKIIGEEYQPTYRGEDTERPLIASLTYLDRLRRDHRAVAELVAGWAKAWSSKDIEQYKACYAKDFRSRSMGLKAWIRYKDGLNKRYDWIDVSVEDLTIRRNGDRSTATFLQRYRSTGHNSVGAKRLRLKRVDDSWKIYRETWYETRK